jgi:hypothetical protein
MITIVHEPVLSINEGGWKFHVQCEGSCPKELWYKGEGAPPDINLAGVAFFLPVVMHLMSKGGELVFHPKLCEKFANRFKAATAPLLHVFAPDLLPFIIDYDIKNPTHLSRTQLDGSAAGMSCGLDSLASVAELRTLPSSHAFSLRLLAHFDTGNHNASRSEGPHILYESRVTRSQRCATDMGLPLISITSNVDEWVPGQFARLHTIRNISAAHLLSHRVGNYFYANGIRISDTSLTGKDTAYIDSLLIPLLSTEVFHVHQSTPDLGAPEKTKLIGQWQIAQRHLNVCYYEDKNCGKCDKCLRRMILLDAIGVYQNFAKLFPSGDLENQRGWYLGYLNSRASNSKLHAEIIAFLRITGYPHLSSVTNWKAWIMRRAENRWLRFIGRPRRPL